MQIPKKYDGDSFGVREFTAWKNQAEEGDQLLLIAKDMNALIHRLSACSTHEITITHTQGETQWYLQLTYSSNPKNSRMLKRYLETG